jgi:hypothetical protein
VRDHVVQLPGDAAALLGPRPLGEVRLRCAELGHERELVADQEAATYGHADAGHPGGPPGVRLGHPLRREQHERADPEAQRSPTASGQGAPHAQDGEGEPTHVAGATVPEDRNTAGRHDRPQEHGVAARQERDRAGGEGHCGRGPVEGQTAGQPHGEGHHHEGREGAEGHPPRPQRQVLGQVSYARLAGHGADATTP